MKTLFAYRGGRLVLPDAGAALVDRADGGNLVVNPPRSVWERSELTSAELTGWSFLVAASGRAMLDVLPQLAGGCVNYWEAGNWALNEQAEPAGPKTGPAHRRVHLHLLGRSRTAADPSWRWGEAPRFPDYCDRASWSARFERLTARECADVVRATERALVDRYAVPADALERWDLCVTCAYPTALADAATRPCAECAGKSASP